MKTPSSKTLLVFSIVAASACVAGFARAQSYPSKSIRMVISLAPGGGVDTTARYIATKLNQAWGQAVIPDNRPGAGGVVAADTLAKAPPDGYTLLVASSGMTITPSIVRKLPYNPFKDVLPVTLAVISPGVMVVHPSLPVKNVKELIAFAKSRPEQLLYSSSGAGSGQHLAMAEFAQMTGIRMTHVPYKGTAPSVTDVVAGRITVTIASVISTRPFFTSGKLRALAVVGPKRTPAVPDMPTVAESGVPGYGYDNWYAVFLPGATDKSIAGRLQRTIAQALTEPESRKFLLSLGLDVVCNTPDEFAKMYTAEIAKWPKLVRAIGLEPN